MASKKKAINKDPTKTSEVSTKKSIAKKTSVKPKAATATQKKVVQSQRIPKAQEAANSSESAAKLEEVVDESKSSSRTSYEKLVNPQNYHEYMRASKFRGRH